MRLRKDAKLAVAGAEGPRFYIGGKRRRMHHQVYGRTAALMSAMGREPLVGPHWPGTGRLFETGTAVAASPFVTAR